MNHQRMLHFTNGVLFAINAGLWGAYAHRPVLALAWAVVSIASLYFMWRAE